MRRYRVSEKGRGRQQRSDRTDDFSSSTIGSVTLFHLYGFISNSISTVCNPSFGADSFFVTVSILSMLFELSFGLIGGRKPQEARTFRIAADLFEHVLLAEGRFSIISTKRAVGEQIGKSWKKCRPTLSLLFFTHQLTFYCSEALIDYFPRRRLQTYFLLSVNHYLRVDVYRVKREEDFVGPFVPLGLSPFLLSSERGCGCAVVWEPSQQSIHGNQGFKEMGKRGRIV